MTKRIWLPLRARHGNRTYMPIFGAYLTKDGWTSGHIAFLLDSGAGYSFVPMAYAGGLLDPETTKEDDTGCKDFNDDPIRGVRVKLRLHIPGLDAVDEEIIFSSSLKARVGLLGQATVFEQFGAVFHNFRHAPKGRRFSLFTPEF